MRRHAQYGIRERLLLPTLCRCINYIYIRYERLSDFHLTFLNTYSGLLKQIVPKETRTITCTVANISQASQSQDECNKRTTCALEYCPDFFAIIDNRESVKGRSIVLETILTKQKKRIWLLLNVRLFRHYFVIYSEFNNRKEYVL